MSTFIKSLIAGILLTTSTIVIAGNRHGHGFHHHHRFHNNHWHHNHGWVAPAIIGGALVYGLTRPTIIQTVPVTPQVIQVETQVVCSEWREVQYPDGRIVQERTCNQQ